MNLSEYLNTKPRGALVALSKATGSHPPDVSNWASGKRPVPPHRAASIEQATNGEVTRRDLRPNDWHEIWPELAEKDQQPSQALSAAVAVETTPLDTAAFGLRSVVSSKR